MVKNQTHRQFLCQKVVLPAFFLLLAIMPLSSFTSLQEPEITIDVKNGTFYDVISQIESQTGFMFFYNSEDINNDTPLSLSLQADRIEDILTAITKDQGLSYRIKDKHILITKWEPISQQTRKVLNGSVRDINSEPILGANVFVKGTTTGVITDLDGMFTIEADAGSTLVISYIGFVTEEILVRNQTTFTIILREDAQALDEIVVIGYGTAKRRDLTGAIASVKTEKMEVEAPRDITDLMRGTAAGLNVGMSTSAKGDLTPSIRGVTTLTAGSSPTLVVDGVIYYGALSDINANDVESIDVLKDASSAAVYGSQAANGVIVINTKKGRGKADGSATVTFNANFGFVQSANQMKLLDGKGYIKYRQDYQIEYVGEAHMAQYPEMYTNPLELGGTGVNQLDWYNYNQKDPVSSVSDEDLIRAWLSRLQFYTPEIENYLAGIETDWSDLVLQKGLQQDYTVSVSNRTDKITYHWSLGYVDRNGIIVGDNYKNVRTRLNLDSKITDFLTIGTNTNFSVRDEGSQAVSWSAMVRNSPYASNNMDDPESLYRYYVAGDAMTTNPLYAREYRDQVKMYYSLNSNIYAKIKLPFDIEYQVNFTPYFQWYNEYYHQAAESEVETQGGTAHRRHDVRYHWTVDNIIHWKKEFDKKHNIEVTLLANAEKRQTWSTTANAYDFNPSDVLGYHHMAAGLVPTIQSSDTYWTGDALMGRLFYSYRNKYMLTTSVRRDGYSAFGAHNKRATFPSLALGYVFTSENFMKSITNWLTYGKLRFSWGQNGNRDIGQYAALSNMTTNFITYINNTGLTYTSTYLYVSTMANKGLKWERTESYNVGLDFSLFNDLVSGSIEAYSGTTKDLLVARSLPSITGFSSVMANLGKLRNKGLEITVNANLIRKQDFHWYATSTFSMNRRKIISLYGDMENIVDDNGNVVETRETDDPGNEWFIGQDPDRIWAYERLGVWQLGEEKEAAVYGCKPGDFKYKDQNNDGVLNTEDKVLQGYKTPRFRLSLRNEFAFRDFMLSLSLYSYLGHYGSFNEAANYNSGMPYRYSYYDMPRWTKDNPTNDYARISSYNAGTNWVKKSFVRIDNLALSYNVPKAFARKFSVQQMRLSLTVRNLAVWSPQWSFWDPENGSLSPRTFNLGINFTL